MAILGLFSADSQMDVGQNQVYNNQDIDKLVLLQIPPLTMETMLMHVEAGYASHGNPYHNHMHACDVLQTVHYFISQTGLSVSE